MLTFSLLPQRDSAMEVAYSQPVKSWQDLEYWH